MGGEPVELEQFVRLSSFSSSNALELSVIFYVIKKLSRGIWMPARSAKLNPDCGG